MANPPDSAAVIPVALGEMLYVSLRHVLDYTTERRTYPPGLADNMQKVLRRYERDRTQALVSRGFQETAVLRWTMTASEKVTAWLQEKSARTEEAEADFGRWQKELSSGEDLS